MKKTISLILLISLFFISSAFASDNAQNYDIISLYLHGVLGVDGMTTSFSLPEKNGANREGVFLKVGVDGYKNEDLGAKLGATADLSFSLPFRSEEKAGINLGKLPYLGLSGGIIFRSRPWDYIDISLSLKGNVSIFDYSSISLGLSLEPQADIYFFDDIYLKVSLSYGSDIAKIPFGGDKYLVWNNLPSRFTFGIGCGYAFGGYSR